MRKITLTLTLIALIVSSFIYGQTNRVKITVNWTSQAHENMVEVYDPANNLLVSICNNIETTLPNDNCFNTTGSEDLYTATYDLGCLAIAPAILPDYYIVLKSADNEPWDDGSVVVNVAGVDSPIYEGTLIMNSSGETHSFSVNDMVNVCTQEDFPDTDMDGVIDFVDQDDDNDGILDTQEGLALNQFDCTVPSLIFQDGVYESGGTSGLGDDVGSIWRFSNAVNGENYDVLLKIVELTNTSIVILDDDSAGSPTDPSTPEFLQSELTFSGSGVPGVTYEFSIVEVGTSNLANDIFRIGGTTWDCDGTNTYQESVRYYNPSAFGLDNPTSLTTDIYPDGAGITAGTTTYPGFSTNTTLRSYFQFLSNQFTIRMQLKKTTEASQTRLYAMSFTQCDIFDYKAPTLTILQGKDTDDDDVDDQLDLDSDNDGIPDNIEFQSTLGYVEPTMTLDAFGNPVTDLEGNVIGVDPVSGIDDSYQVSMAIVDTDGDNIPDFIDSDSDGDGKLDIDENGMSYDLPFVFEDADEDGISNQFEGGINPLLELDPFDVNDDINDPASSILPDSDSDLTLGGDLDYRDALDVFIESASVDFDGVDDHIATDSFMGGWTDATIMAWIKLDTDFKMDGDVAGQGVMRMYVDGTTLKLHSYHITNGGSSVYGSSSPTALEVEKWYHVAISYQGSSGIAKIYINGEEVSSLTIGSGNALSSDQAYTGADFNIGRNSIMDNSYFYGSIDEVRVFNTVLTEDQLQQMVYQEINQEGANVKGIVMDKPIVDIASSATVPWLNLQAYYPMSSILSGKTVDASGNNRDATLKNIFTVQEQSAPMPYETVSDGPWSSTDTWKYGNVWDITDIGGIKEWAIVKVANDITLSESLNTLGMTIDTGSSLSILEDKALTNNWYLELNGTLDLEGDSQLIQTMNSDLVTSGTGKILRRQEGNSNVYWYNYWSSPVGTPEVTTLSDNNGPGNNTNNSPFNIDMLKDGNGVDVEFTSAFDEIGKVSDKWLYSYQNGLTYYDWVALTPSSEILPGVGYTQKGMGVPNESDEQEYIFNGKPNNGTILIPADDVPDSGNESEQDVTLTTSLLGNPYPSAIDARLFIQDNDGVIEGTVLLWEQWSGSSHLLAEYEGGYGYITDNITERAYQYPGINLADPDGLTPGIKIPTFHIPVAQGFFVEVIEDGNIVFKNSQRVFIKETDADGENPENGSTFFRDSEESNESNDLQILRLEFSVSNGASRSFVLGFNEEATVGLDYGKDGGKITNPPADDMGSFLNGHQYVIQTLPLITPEKVIDLYFNASGEHTYSLDITELKNIEATQDIFLRDNLENITWDLRQGPYNFSAVLGEDTERFDIVFEDNSLSNDEFVLDGVVMYVSSKDNMLYVKGLDQDVKNLSLINMLGQTVKVFNNTDRATLENGVYIGELSSGVYLVNLVTEENLKLDKKIVLE